jgi:hypothetical protein
MTYNDTTSVSLQFINLYIELCDKYASDPALTSQRKTSLASIVKWLLVHEIGHYIYHIKNTSHPTFETICRTENKNLCTNSDFITSYAQTNSEEDYAEHFAYRYFHTLQQQETLQKPENPTTKKFQEKMKYFTTVF